eukprot:CAMPEP_0174329714 /NCGR_PEP_ID=MMETSP0810-20121108/16082_1 /TAXON_ID=73025 ORGANISM="Eutreptiella gymnastica-like, Strain CCMP1594" /NCGR_SAMPLE_ID=MMETSP0810 /ASSEMBLY_ACC=CAM_ASM_000659 /LENGTH=145 /DNA_ID=CAMNT_0015444415 /DNA_START=39 /DNA_END=473 /DNA_ORIENTATION=+
MFRVKRGYNNAHLPRRPQSAQHWGRTPRLNKARKRPRPVHGRLREGAAQRIQAWGMIAGALAAPESHRRAAGNGGGSTPHPRGVGSGPSGAGWGEGKQDERCGGHQRACQTPSNGTCEARGQEGAQRRGQEEAEGALTIRAAQRG